MQSNHKPPSQLEYPGAKWWRVDFHTHTPHSQDAYRALDGSETISDRQWLLEHMRKGIDVVCITDHNGGGRIDALKGALIALEAELPPPEGYRPLTLVPGVELTTANDVHLLALFDPSAGSTQISQLLGVAGMEDAHAQGDHTAQLREGLKTILDKAQSPTIDCIIIPAHVNLAKGLMRLQNARTRQSVLAHQSIYALECGWASVPDWNNFLETTHGPFATVFGSDSHEIEEIGRRTTWVHMEEPTLDALRIALLDGGSSVREFVEQESVPGPPTDMWIRSLSLSNLKHAGRPNPLEFEFNPGLNTIIGGRGTGKSTALEVLRSVLQYSSALGDPERDELRLHHDELVAEALEPAIHEVLVEYSLHGQRFRMLKCGAHEFPTLEEGGDDNSWTPSTLPKQDWPNRFPIRIYSQKQLYGFRKGTARLLAEIDIDSSIGHALWAQEHQEAVSQMIQQTTRLEQLSAQVARKDALTATLNDVERRIKQLEDMGHERILRENGLFSIQSSEIELWEQGLEDNIQNLKDLCEGFEAESLSIRRNPDRDDNPAEDALEVLTVSIVSSVTSGKALLVRLTEDLENGLLAWRNQKEESIWAENRKRAETEYSELAGQMVTPGERLSEVHQKLMQDKATAQQSLAAIERAETEKDELSVTRSALLERIQQRRIELSERRGELLASIFGGRRDLNVSLVRFGDRVGAERSFREVIQRTDNAFSEISELLDALYAGGRGPSCEELKRFRDSLYDAAGRGELHDGYGEVRVTKRLCQHLEGLSIEDWARLESWYPGDGLHIEIRRDGGAARYVDIERASPGQVATAVLSFLLSYGNTPLILDQPEDDLDNQMIYNVVVKDLQKNKSRRQVIIVTHNPNLVVNGNADMVFPLDASTGPTVLAESGTLQNSEVRESVCKVMEGGKIALEQRFRRMIQPNSHAIE